MRCISRPSRFAAVAAACLLPLCAQAQGPTAGQLLVATPALEDPSFSASVILLLHHSDEGSLGVFIDRPTWVDAGEAFPEREGLGQYHGALYHGGPVSPTQLLILARNAPDPAVDSTRILAGVHLVADLTVLSASGAADRRDDMRVYAGHSAWGPGQLEEEIASGGWRVVGGDADLVFSAEPLELWRALSGFSASELTVSLQ
jgi:putative transcriptional regulator